VRPRKSCDSARVASRWPPRGPSPVTGTPHHRGSTAAARRSASCEEVGPAGPDFQCRTRARRLSQRYQDVASARPGGTASSCTPARSDGTACAARRARAASQRQPAHHPRACRRDNRTSAADGCHICLSRRRRAAFAVMQYAGILHLVPIRRIPAWHSPTC
jgi:hypothetical protein